MSRIKRQHSFRIPEIGKIKVGSKNERGLPQSHDYFVCTGKYSEIFKKRFGDKPDQLTITFLSDDIDSVCNERLELRDKDGRLAGKGDGENYYIFSKKTNDYILTNHDKAMKAIDFFQSAKGWESILTIRFLLVEIKGVLGVFSLTTKASKSSIDNIISVFDYVKERCGTVAGFPFVLEVEKVKSQKPDARFSFPVIKLIANVSDEKMNGIREAIESGLDIRKLDFFDEQEYEIKQLK